MRVCALARNIDAPGGCGIGGPEAGNGTHLPPPRAARLLTPRTRRAPRAGRHNARQCLLTRGLMPMLATPQPNSEQILEEAIQMAAK